MTEKPFEIYRSSAGSGKTYQLASEYLKIAAWTWEQYQAQGLGEEADPQNFEWHDEQRQLVRWRVDYRRFSTWFEETLAEQVENQDETALAIQQRLSRGLMVESGDSAKSDSPSSTSDRAPPPPP